MVSPGSVRRIIRRVAYTEPRGIRLPRALMDEAGLIGEVDIHAEPGRTTVTPVALPRLGSPFLREVLPEDWRLESPGSSLRGEIDKTPQFAPGPILVVARPPPSLGGE